MKRPVPVESASALIDEKIKELGDWRGKTLAKVREIIHEADPEIVEEWKSVASAATGLPWWHVAAPFGHNAGCRSVVEFTATRPDSNRAGGSRQCSGKDRRISR